MLNIDVATRFHAASHEMFTKIFNRNQTLLHFTAFSAVVIGWGLIGGSESSIIAVSIPYISLFVVLMTSYHERTIYKLAEFQASLTTLDEGSIPDWYSDHFYFGLTPQRILKDWAKIYVILPISLGALLLIYSRWDGYALEYRASYLVAVIVACLSLAAATTILVFNMRAKKRLPFFQKARSGKDPTRAKS